MAPVSKEKIAIIGGRHYQMANTAGVHVGTTSVTGWGEVTDTTMNIAPELPVAVHLAPEERQAYEKLHPTPKNRHERRKLYKTGHLKDEARKAQVSRKTPWYSR